jgi:HK97 gp10 family phage protein
MPDAVTMKLEGFSELADKLKELGPKVEASGLRGANYAGAKVLVDAAKQTTAWRDVTGELRSHIRTFRRTAPAGTVTHAVGVSGTRLAKYGHSSTNRKLGRIGQKYYTYAGPALYGRFLEFGTSRMPPHSWLRPAFITKVDEIVGAIKQGLSDAIDKAAK